MARLILYMGPSGVGKTSSLRNLDPKSTMIITPNGKPMPFPGGAKKYVRGTNLFVNNNLTGGAGDAQNALEKLDLKDFVTQVSKNAKHIKTLVIEDFTHFFSARIFSDEFLSQNSGNAAFQRWNQFGADVFQSLFEDSSLREDLFIVILHHTETKEDGMQGFKSSGNLLDKTIDVPSYFTYVLHGLTQTKDDGTHYLMQTNKDSIRHAKTPPGLFEDKYIRNDMKEVLDRITKYNAGEIKGVVWK